MRSPHLTPSFGLLGVLAWVTLGGCRGAAPPSRSAPVEEGAHPFVLTSDAFRDGAPVPAEYTCDGGNGSPPLQWSEVPPGTAGFALIVHDPDAPGGEFTHWVLFDIPGSARELPAQVKTGSTGVAGGNDFGQTGYGGPCPPGGRPHHYVFTLYALDLRRTGLRQGASRAEVEAAIRGHVLGRAELAGTYERRF